jgi:hypothetical protein
MVHYPSLSDPNLDRSNSHQDISQSFFLIPVLNYDVGARPRLLSRGVTTIRTASFIRLGIPNYTTYVKPNLAYINSYLSNPKPERVHRHPRAQYSLNPAQF